MTICAHFNDSQFFLLFQFVSVMIGVIYSFSCSRADLLRLQLILKRCQLLLAFFDMLISLTIIKVTTAIFMKSKLEWHSRSAQRTWMKNPAPLKHIHCTFITDIVLNLINYNYSTPNLSSQFINFLFSLLTRLRLKVSKREEKVSCCEVRNVKEGENRKKNKTRAGWMREKEAISHWLTT